ncbi:hypothetical protein VE01_09661 [Pseudogymnoascus verrucosus]|uniref:Uncharacterized protein n=1 Tax=Pseudogymnoascus verrucosus TaxID=342668 RepID=A0A1B8G9R8_9PEZI|nr:uncharacterized protein VE01_09661 [Pseudogymnoascus verrucosus]OBT92561.1 hypothetical protein VE01_09661 [Pseudogymnoascus verrucosus]
MGTVSAGRMIWEKKMRGGDLEDQEGEDGELGGLVVRSVEKNRNGKDGGWTKDSDLGEDRGEEQERRKMEEGQKASDLGEDRREPPGLAEGSGGGDLDDQEKKLWNRKKSSGMVPMAMEDRILQAGRRSLRTVAPKPEEVKLPPWTPMKEAPNNATFDLGNSEQTTTMTEKKG